MAYTQRGQDDFTDANSTPLASHTPDQGGAWTMINGDLFIISGQLSSAAGGSAINAVSLANKQKAQVTVNEKSAYPHVSCRVTWDGVNLSGYFVYCNAAFGYVLARWDGSGTTSTTLDNTTLTSSANGDVMAIEAEGDQIRVYVNGSLGLTVTDATWASGKAGCGCGLGTAVDDWRAYDEDASPPPTSLPLIVHHLQSQGIM